MPELLAMDRSGEQGDGRAELRCRAGAGRPHHAPLCDGTRGADGRADRPSHRVLERRRGCRRHQRSRIPSSRDAMRVVDVFPRSAWIVVRNSVLICVVLLTAACAVPGQAVRAPAQSSPVVVEPRTAASARSAAPSSTPLAPSIVVVDEAGAVPWADRPGTMFFGSPLPVAPLPTSGPPCRAADLKVSDFGGNGGGGHSYTTFDFMNVSSVPCILQGFPRVVATEPGKPSVTAGDGAFFVGKEQSATMQPGATTSLSLETERDCTARGTVSSGSPTLIYHTATVSIPGGGTVVLRDTFDVECCLYTGKFSVDQPQPEYTKSPIVGATAQLELPSAVKAGSTLKYVIDLSNPTTNDLVLDPCPGYQQALGEAGNTILSLNCDAAPVLAAHTTDRFAMEIAVPADFPTGPTGIYWNIAAIFDNLTDDVAAHASIQVDGADTPCMTDQLSAAIAGPGVVPGWPNMFFNDRATTAVGLIVTNRSTTSCSVRGTPAVNLTSSGKDLDQGQADQREMARTPTIVPAPTVVLAPGGTATTQLYWYSDWCGADPNPLTVTVTLPANGATATATAAGGWHPPPCRDGAGGHGQVGADPLQVG